LTSICGGRGPAGPEVGCRSFDLQQPHETMLACKLVQYDRTYHETYYNSRKNTWSATHVATKYMTLPRNACRLERGRVCNHAGAWRHEILDLSNVLGRRGRRARALSHHRIRRRDAQVHESSSSWRGGGGSEAGALACPARSGSFLLELKQASHMTLTEGLACSSARMPRSCQTSSLRPDTLVG
jgi:hypothetical protein